MTSRKDVQQGFSLVELVVAMAIVSIGTMSVIPSIHTRFRQASVDSYTQKLEAGLNQLKANMIGRQDSCTLRFPSGEIGPIEIDNLAIEESSDQGDPDCPKPSRMGTYSVTDDNGNIIKDSNGYPETEMRTMASTKLRLLNIRNSHNNFEAEDLKIKITPDTITINTVGGVVASTQPLLIRIRSESLFKNGKGHERCLEMEPTTGSLNSGTWKNSTCSTS